MPSITDWLMVAITAVYVVATIFICWANIKAANATREQVIESRRQFDEMRRLEVLPYLQFDSYDGMTDKTLRLALASNDLDGGTYIKKLVIKNVGFGTANNITGVWNWFTGGSDKNVFPASALRSGETEKLKFEFALPKKKYERTSASMILEFEDLLGSRYSQTIEFNFEDTQRGLQLQGYKNYPPTKLE